MSEDDSGLGFKVHEDAYRELEEEAERYRFEANTMMMQRDRLAEAAQAVVDRWETPFWKEVGQYHYIDSLRKAVEEVKGGQP